MINYWHLLTTTITPCSDWVATLHQAEIGSVCGGFPPEPSSLVRSSWCRLIGQRHLYNSAATRYIICPLWLSSRLPFRLAMAGPCSLRSISYLLVESIRVSTIYTKALKHIPDPHFISLIFHWSPTTIYQSPLQTPNSSCLRERHGRSQAVPTFPWSED